MIKVVNDWELLCTENLRTLIVATTTKHMALFIFQILVKCFCLCQQWKGPFCDTLVKEMNESDNSDFLKFASAEQKEQKK